MNYPQIPRWYLSTWAMVFFFFFFFLPQPCHKELQKKWLKILQAAKKQLFVLKNILKSSGKLCCVGWWLLKFQRNTVHYILWFKETYPKRWIVAQCAAPLVDVRCVQQVDFKRQFALLSDFMNGRNRITYIQSLEWVHMWNVRLKWTDYKITSDVLQILLGGGEQKQLSGEKDQLIIHFGIQILFTTKPGQHSWFLWSLTGALQGAVKIVKLVKGS